MHYGLEDYLLDLVQNAISSGARRIDLEVSEEDRRIRVVVRDDGGGMDEETQQRALDPFYSDGKKHPGRRVGLGLPFVRQIAEATGGRFGLQSKPGRGTTVEVEIPTEHPDAPPFSDPAGCLTMLLTSGGQHELAIKRSHRGETYTIRRTELVEAIGELESVEANDLVRSFVESQEGT